jgi:hypothetical protein
MNFELVFLEHGRITALEEEEEELKRGEGCAATGATNNFLVGFDEDPLSFIHTFFSTQRPFFLVSLRQVKAKGIHTQINRREGRKVI